MGATKWDALKSRSVTQADRKAIMQALRFAAHYNGASLYCTSSIDSALKDSFRSVMGSICFRTTLKTFKETSPDKPVYVTAGADNFEDILLGEHASDMLRSDAELVDYISESGIARKCWDRFLDFHGSLFGPPTIENRNSTESKTDEGGDEDGDNDYPEAEIDAIRAEKDVQLQQYILEADRKEQLLKKMYGDVASKPSAAFSGSSRNKKDGDENFDHATESKRRDEGITPSVDGDYNESEHSYSEGKSGRK